MPTLRSLALTAFTATMLLAAPGAADMPAIAFDDALHQLPDGGTRLFAHLPGAAGTALLVQTRDRKAALDQGLFPITDTLAVGHRHREIWRPLSNADGIFRTLLAPSRYPLMDRAGETIDLHRAQNDSGLSGEGSIIGVVDTGGDPTHPALRDEDGRSRIAWYLIFGREALGLHPEIEIEYGCTGEDPCAVLSRADIDEALLGNPFGFLPDDPVGHATHITSLAAGRDDEYPGVAPNADLILVSAADPTGGVSDARILLGAKFVFDRATEMGRPAVVNVSLGSSFGAHDGTAFVERGLAALGSGEGRAVVLASGNAGQLLRDVSRDYPEPFGIHTEVAVLAASQVRVPVLSPPSTSQTLSGSVFVWISTRPGDDISLGFSNGKGAQTALVGRGDSGAITSAELDDSDNFDVILLNGVNEGLDADIEPGSMVVAVIGSWENGRTFELILEGHGNARLWVMGTGGFAPHENPSGPLFPRAVSSGTVAVPGSHPDLITVGATINRNDWRDFSGELVGYDGPSTGRAPFSAAGPNQTGAMKPELAAPGGGVIGAMARSADPRTSVLEVSQFASYGTCPDAVECFVIDDEHGIASGTSMAAPIVAGTIALLMQRDPSLTMEQAKHYLMAGTEPVGEAGASSMVGTGQLDIIGALLAQERDRANSPETPSASHCRVVWASDFVYPGTGPALRGYLITRNAENESVEPEEGELSFQVEGPGRVTFENLVPGLIELQVTAEDGSAAQELTVVSKLLGETIARDTFVIERDPSLAEHGYELTGGTCRTGSVSGRVTGPSLFFVLLTAALLRGRRRAQRRR